MRAVAGSLHPACPLLCLPLTCMRFFPSVQTGGTTRLPPLCLGVALQGSCLEEQLMPQKWPLAFRKVRFLLLGFASMEVVEGAGGVSGS